MEKKRNLFVTPTNKPSRLYVRNDVSPLFYSNFQGDAVNIYITNDEEIKEGDWYLTIRPDFIGKPAKCIKINAISVISQLENSDNTNHTQYTEFKYAKKIILTTDTDLIKDDIQAIDDEFLEWFVAHPTCEMFEVDEETLFGNIGYKIIIPKEEPKQEINIDDVGISSTQIFTLKQETLEEAAENNLTYWKGFSGIGLPNAINSDRIKKSFEAGAKWQQKRSQANTQYLIGLLKQTTEYEVLQSFRNKVEVIENQQERSYSEEDMRKSYCKGYIADVTSSLNNAFDKWFEQFKKK